MADEDLKYSESSAWVDVRAKYGLKGNNDPGDGARIQLAFDREPALSTLVIARGVYRIDAPLVMTKLHHLWALGASFRGMFGTVDRDVLEIKITDAGGNLDVRKLSIFGGIWSTGVLATNPTESCRHAISVTGGVGAILPIVCMNISRFNAAGGRDASIAFYDSVAHSSIDLAEIGGDNGCVAFRRTPDGNKVRNSTIGGKGTGVEIDTLDGAFNTRVLDNVIVCVKEGINIINSSQYTIIGNQMEQSPTPASGSPPAMIVVRGTARTCQRGQILYNNFGGGTNAVNMIHIDNARNILIDGNTFGPVFSPGSDIVLTANAVGVRIGPSNFTRGLGTALRDAITDTSRKLIVADSGSETFGVFQGAAKFGLANGWGAVATFTGYKDLSGYVRFRGQLTPGTLTIGTLIMTLPLGMRPSENFVCILATADTSGPTTSSAVDVATTGAVTLRSTVPATATQIMMQGLSFHAIGDGTYLPGS